MLGHHPGQVRQDGIEYLMLDSRPSHHTQVRPEHSEMPMGGVNCTLDWEERRSEDLLHQVPHPCITPLYLVNNRGVLGHLAITDSCSQNGTHERCL
jgi:hypothetical protein